jgi:GAF domain-containing protein
VPGSAHSRLLDLGASAERRPGREVVADFANGAFPWSAAARRRRIRSGIWLGLGGGRGLLTVHSRLPRRFSADEVGLLRGVGEVLGARWA